MPFIDLIDNEFTGIVPVHAFRNAQPANGQATRALARALNFISAKRGTIIPGMEQKPADARNVAGDLVLWRARYRASQNGTTLVVVTVLIPTATTVGTPTHYITIDGVAQTSRTHNRRVLAGGGTALSDLFVDTMEYTVTANAKHTVSISTINNCRVVGWYMYEKPRTSLTVGTDTMIDYTRIMPLSPIYDADWAALVTQADGIWQKLRGAFIAWSADDPATPRAASSTTFTQIFESTGTAGAVAYTQYRNSYMNDVAATSTIDMYFWAFMERTAGVNTVDVRFQAGGTTMATVTCNSTAAIYDTTATIPVAAAVKYLTMQYAVSTAGTTGNVYSAGCMPLFGT